MEVLPSPLLIDILSRVADSTDLARSRLSSRTLKALSYSVTSVSLLCSHRRLLRSRHPSTRPLTLPFKILVLNNLHLLRYTLDSLSIGIEKPFANADDNNDEDELDDSDDLHLTAVDFVAGWVEIVGERLRRIEISDYWVQSCWRRSEALAVISDRCGSLLDLVVRNAWLSAERLKPMPKLTKLTLEFIRLDDEDLDKVNECFPSLHVLNLIGVGGLKDPKIHLSELKFCRWTVSNLPLSLSIHAPHLTELKLHCVDPNTVVLETPLLSHLDLKIRKPGRIIDLRRLYNLKCVNLDSSYFCSLSQLFVGNKTIAKIEIDIPDCIESEEQSETVSIMDLVNAFPNTHDMTLRSGAWIKLEKSFVSKVIGDEFAWRNLEKLMMYLPLRGFDFEFLSRMLNLCAPFGKVILLVHAEASTTTRSELVSWCKTNFPKIMWKWGIWEELRDISFDMG